jgi:hypothetical protein
MVLQVDEDADGAKSSALCCVDSVLGSERPTQWTTLAAALLAMSASYVAMDRDVSPMESSVVASIGVGATVFVMCDVEGDKTVHTVLSTVIAVAPAFGVRMVGSLEAAVWCAGGARATAGGQCIDTLPCRIMSGWIFRCVEAAIILAIFHLMAQASRRDGAVESASVAPRTRRWFGFAIDSIFCLLAATACVEFVQLLIACLWRNVLEPASLR